jgi:hypothetical protein
MKRLSKRTAHKSVLAFRAIVASLILFASLSLARAQETPALDGPQATFQDELLDKMAGNWTLSGQIAGRSAQHSIEAKWTLNHQFLQIHEIDKNPTKGPPGYEAFAFIGYDHLSERYLIHWIDIFGGRASETIGYGHRTGDSVEFVFEYPEAPFHTTFHWNTASKGWEWHMTTRDKTGRWESFGDMTLARAATP